MPAYVLRRVRTGSCINLPSLSFIFAGKWSNNSSGVLVSNGLSAYFALAERLQPHLQGA
jgi:hypothetical protein